MLLNIGIDNNESWQHIYSPKQWLDIFRLKILISINTIFKNSCNIYILINLLN